MIMTKLRFLFDKKKDYLKKKIFILQHRVAVQLSEAGSACRSRKKARADSEFVKSETN
jgi:hypothetical protein